MECIYLCCELQIEYSLEFAWAPYQERVMNLDVHIDLYEESTWDVGAWSVQERGRSFVVQSAVVGDHQHHGCKEGVWIDADEEFLDVVVCNAAAGDFDL